MDIPLKQRQGLHVQWNHGKEGRFMPNQVFKNDSNKFISNIKETVDVTLATDDDGPRIVQNYVKQG
jgi:hypothetical protein